MKKIDFFKKYSLYALLATTTLFTNCTKNDDEVVPEKENELEIITDVKLIFTNNADAADIVTATAKDPDGAGVQPLIIEGKIDLHINKTYTLSFEIMNNLEIPGEDIGKEIKEEDKEHQFFFSFSNDAFSNPTGNGNIDTASDPINYNDKDGNGNPVGLSTTWTTSSNILSKGVFTVRLQHQPNVKTATSDTNDGDTDFELKFELNIK